MPWTVNPDHGYLERFDTAGSIGAITILGVDGATAPGTDPVLPDGSGEIDLTGAQVASGIVGANVLRAYSVAANEVTYQIQQSGSAAAKNTTLNGVAHFNSTEFSVDEGFVSLLGGSEAIDSINVDTSTAPGTDPVLPDVSGMITVTGGQVATGTVGANVIRTNSVAANTYTIEIQRSTSAAATDSTLNGVSHFDSDFFTVDSNGFVSASGTGLAQTITGSSGGPLSPVLGNWNILGSSTAAGTTPVSTPGIGNTLTVRIQKSQAIAATDATKVGLSNFNSAQFTVDANGFVSLAGGGLAIDSINVDASTGPGTDPVVPDGAGQITVTGAQVATGTIGANVIRTNSLAANTYTIEVQRSTAVAATDSTKNGVSHFDSASFAVDSSGFVSASGTGLGKTITGDSGGPLSPTAGNWDIFGGPGVTTSGSGSTLTINSVVFTDQAVSTTVTRDSGSFCTAAGVTLTLPATPAQGELLHFVCATSDVLILQAPAATTIRIGSLVSSSAGTATSTLIGDSLTLRYYAAGTQWIATSVIGTWVVA